MIDLTIVSKICSVSVATSLLHYRAYQPASDIYRTGFLISATIAGVLAITSDPNLDLTPLSQKVILPLLCAGFSSLSWILWYNLRPQPGPPHGPRH